MQDGSIVPHDQITFVQPLYRDRILWLRAMIDQAGQQSLSFVRRHPLDVMGVGCHVEVHSPARLVFLDDLVLMHLEVGRVQILKVYRRAFLPAVVQAVGGYVVFVQKVLLQVR